MEELKKGDFIELDYTGTLKEDNSVFDTTDKAVAEKNDINPEISEFGPVIICLGEGMLLKGLEDKIEGKEIGKEYTFDISVENAFGKKDAKMVRMIPMSAFRKNQIMPEAGMPVNIDGMTGTVKTVSGGRCMVDFNHPLSGKELVYKVKVNRKVDDDKEKLNSFLKLMLDIKNAEIEIKEGKAAVKIEKDMPKELSENIVPEIKRMIPSIKEVIFEKKQKQAVQEKAKKAENKPSL